MKTLEKFECPSCFIKVQMQTAKECFINNKDSLYKVTTTPKNKNSWKEYSKDFNFNKDANKYFMKEIKYWLF